jgi:formylmethanofuran dehydrogenase subunit C
MPPLKGQTVIERVKAGKASFQGEEWEEVSTEAKSLVGRMLERGKIYVKGNIKKTLPSDVLRMKPLETNGYRATLPDFA